MITKIAFATSNPGKIEEARAILPGIEIVPYEELCGKIDVPETGATFKENARLKAEAVAKLVKDMSVIADDSGLSIPSLDGFPGVKSRLLIEETGGRDEAFLDLEKRLGELDRSAVFTTAIAFARPGEATMFAIGEMHGFLSFPPRGEAPVLEYDAIFVPNGRGSTLAELGAEWKNLFSHRAMALRKLAAHLSSLGEEEKPEAAAVPPPKEQDAALAGKKVPALPSKRARREVKIEEFEEAMEGAEATKEND